MRRSIAAAAVLWAASGLPGREARAGNSKAYQADIAAFIEQVDAGYPFLDLKGIRGDWEAAKGKLAERAGACRSDAEFLGIVADAIRCLRDSHMGLHDERARPPAPPAEYYPGASFMPAAGGRVIVMSPPGGSERTLPAGTVVATIEGKDAREFLEARAKEAWARGGPFSSPQRARLFEYRIPLRGGRGDQHAITFRSGGRERRVVLRSTVEARGWPHTYNMPAGLASAGEALRYAKLPGGAGYIHIRLLGGDTAAGIARALEAHPDAKGWIVDLRGNGGGGYDEALIERIRSLPRPVAGLIDAGCISAGETFARDLAGHAGARLFGSKTAGASSAKRSWTFPSGIAAVTLPTRSRWRNDRKPIEFNGIDPDLEVEADPDEVAAGMNSAIRRAEEYLAEPARGGAALPRRDSWRVGDHALVKWSGGAHWYRALVTKAEGARFFVRFDDGTEEWADLANMIEDDIRAGDQVFARWKGGRRYFPGRVTSREGEKLHVKYDDGDEEDTTIAFVRVVRPRPED